jgi:hypothetical protein
LPKNEDCRQIAWTNGKPSLMGILLEIKAGPMAGKVISLKSGESVTVGRAQGRAQFALPHDTFMSGLHFAVECGPQGCRVQDRKSSNGTFLNGARIQVAMLANGDEIKSGQTFFIVKIVPDANLAASMPPEAAAPPSARPPQPRTDAPSCAPAPPNQAAPEKSIAPPLESAPSPLPSRHAPIVVADSLGSPMRSATRDKESVSASPSQFEPKQMEHPPLRGLGISRGDAFSVMGWSFPAVPSEWQVQEGFGLQRSGPEDFPSSLAASEESLGGITLQQFVESQISTLRGYLRDPKIDPTMPPCVGGADESMALDVHHSTKDGRELVYHRIYARSGASVGVLTVTTLAANLPQVLQSLQSLLDGAAFHSTVSS